MGVSTTRVSDQCISFAQMNIILNSRIFWRKLATWTRAYLISRYTGIGISEDIYGHLFNILSEYSTMLRLIFGADFSETYYNLIVQHVVILRDLVEAQLANDTEAMNQHFDRLYENANERALYLSRANPYWDYATWSNLINTYINYTIEEANTFITNNYERNVQVFDQLLAHTDTMGDYFSFGIYNFITRYIDLIDDLISAYQAGNIDEINQATRQLYQNADEGAVLLSRMNPFLNQQEWRAILYGLIGSIIEMVVSYLGKQYPRNISIYNRILDQSELIGDNFSKSLFEYIRAFGY